MSICVHFQWRITRMVPHWLPTWSNHLLHSIRRTTRTVKLQCCWSSLSFTTPQSSLPRQLWNLPSEPLTKHSVSCFTQFSLQYNLAYLVFLTVGDLLPFADDRDALRTPRRRKKFLKYKRNRKIPFTKVRLPDLLELTRKPSSSIFVI